MAGGLAPRCAAPPGAGTCRRQGESWAGVWARPGRLRSLIWALWGAQGSRDFWVHSGRGYSQPWGWGSACSSPTWETVEETIAAGSLTAAGTRGPVWPQHCRATGLLQPLCKGCSVPLREEGLPHRLPDQVLGPRGPLATAQAGADPSLRPPVSRDRGWWGYSSWAPSMHCKPGCLKPQGRSLTVPDARSPKSRCQQGGFL